MPDPTLADLAARVTRIETQLGIAPPTSGPAEPAPTPTARPAKPGRPDVALTKDDTVLTWPAVAGASAYDVLDLANAAQPLKQTVQEPRYVGSPYKPGKPARRYAVRARNAAGESELSDIVDVPPAGSGGAITPPPPSTGVHYPADIFGPKWYLTLPTGTQGSPDTVKMPALATYTSKFCELAPTGGVAFRVWHGGVTTKGSPNPRSELRECNPDGSLAKWSAAKGRHSMTIEGQINRLTKVRPHVVVAQIHGAADDVTVARVEGDKLWLTDGDNAHAYLLDAAFMLGKRYSIGIDVTGGVISYRYNGAPVPFTLKSTDAGCYYKTGAYLQSNPKSAPNESPSEYTEVVIFHVDVAHAS